MSFQTRGVVLLLALLSGGMASAQTIGIGTDFPIATLDVRTTDPQISVNIDRELDSPSGSTSALTILDDSDWSAIEATQGDVLNSKEVMHITHTGLGDGLFIQVNNASSGADGLQIWTYGDNQHAIQNNCLGTSAWGMLNLLDNTGVGIYNLHTDDNGVSVYTDMEGVTGSGYFFSNLDLPSLPTPTVGGDGFALDVFVNTTTPSVGSTSYGAVVGADQYGRGHGILLNHHGTSGRNAEFNITNASNTSATIFATNQGRGSAISVQQSNNAIGSTVNVGSFQYTGTESRNHRAVYGYCAPAIGFGIGGYFTGDNYGVIGIDAGNAISGVHAQGNMSATGAKTFLIDHPLDPENLYLRHFAIESNEVLNMYRGIAQFPRSGRAVIELPKYFDAININFSYQLTAIGTSTQPWIVEEIQGNRFTVGGVPGTKVSWTVYANRNDSFVKANPEKVTAEFRKSPQDQGKYLDPQSHGLDETKSIFYAPREIGVPMSRDIPAPLGEGRMQERAREAANEKANYDGSRNQQQPFERMEIRQPVKTMDEIH